MLTSRPDRAPNVRDGVTWERRVNEVASRIEAGDVRGLIKRRININEGTNALILGDGKPRAIAPPVCDFYRNVMKGLRQFTLEDWQRYLMPDMDSAVRDFCSARSVAAIRIAGVAGLKALAMHALDYMKRTCASAGIELSDVRGLRVEDPADADDQDLRDATQGLLILEKLKAMKRRTEADSSPSQAKE